MPPSTRLLPNSRIALAAAALLIAFALLYAALAWNAVRIEQISRKETVLEIAQKATNSYFVELEAAIEDMVDDLQAGPGLGDAARNAGMIRRFKELHPTFTAVNLLDTEGNILASELSPDRAALPRIRQVRGPSWVDFQSKLTPQTKFDLGRPLKATIAPGWFFPMRYVIRGPDGQPVGFISATLSADVLQRFWSDAPVVAKSSLGLIRDDGYLISLFPAPPQADQDAVYRSPRTGVVPRGGRGAERSGYAEGESSILGVPGGYTWQRLENYPVTMFVATPLAEYHRAWWQAVRVPFALILLLGVAGGLAFRVLHQRETALASERRRTEEALAEKRLAERANRTKTEFMARMSHELRTPLNAILGFTQILQRDTPRTLVPEQKRELEHVLHAGHHLLSLIDDLLDLSRVEAGTLALQFGPVDTLDLLRDAMGQVASQAEAQGVALELTPSPRPLPLARADRTRLRQVVLNLLSNAIKYNRRGGRVVLSAALDEGRLRLAVRDTGVGLSAAQLAQLFQPFNRLGREGSGIQGTGIGLMITRSLVEAMDGTLAVTSEEGVGSEFRVTLPLAALGGAGEAGGPDSLPPDHAPGAGAVLYIDDDEVNRILMQSYLGVRPQVQLALAASGVEGLAMARATPQDLLLIDMMMPGMNGLEVLAAVRADPQLRHLPCLAISANAMPDEIETARRAGFDGYLVKPIAVDALLHEIDQRLAPAAAQRQGRSA
jgi:signal transduction histidine kinase/CheY-like chemotaxis protein